jgi:hypothetical protein
LVYPSRALATGLAFGQNCRRRQDYRLSRTASSFCELLIEARNTLLVDPLDSAAAAAALIGLSRDSMLRREPVANMRAMNFGDSLRLTLANQ